MLTESCDSWHTLCASLPQQGADSSNQLDLTARKNVDGGFCLQAFVTPWACKAAQEHLEVLSMHSVLHAYVFD